MSNLRRTGMHIPKGKYREVGVCKSQEEAEELALKTQATGKVRATMIIPQPMKTKTKYLVGAIYICDPSTEARE